MLSPEFAAAFYEIFDEPYYLTQYPEVKAAVSSEQYDSGWEHFLQQGLEEHRSLNRHFDHAYFLTPQANFLQASSEQDLILGREGADALLGLNGNDYINGNQQKDRLYGNQGNDTLDGGLDEDTIWGGKGKDFILGALNHDTLYGELDDDTILGNEGVDNIYGDAGNDYLNGNADADQLWGDAGNDTLHGGQDGDSLEGETGNDQLFGDLGEDTLIGGAGTDTLTGGDEKDIFVIGQKTGGATIQAADYITDFTNNQDLIQLLEPLTFEDLNISVQSVHDISSVILQDKLTGEYLAVLKGVSEDEISPNDFIFTPKPRGEAFPPGYYVAPYGSDENPGTGELPFLTVQKAASIAQAGDTIYLRAGTYRETVTPVNSGTAGNPITFKPYKDEEVIISGADVIGGWTQHAGNIYKTTLSWDLGEGNNQLFANGNMMIEARWPNIPGSPTNITRTDNAIAEAGSVNNPNAPKDAIVTGIYTDTAITQPANFWQGAKINFVPGWNFHPQTGTVTASQPGQIDFNFQWGATDYFTPQAQNSYYLWGSLKALDAPKEWFYESDSQTLYFISPKGTDPSTEQVEAKRRKTAFELKNKSYIQIQDIEVMAANINTNENSSHILLDEVEVNYGSHSQTIEGLYLWGTPSINLAGNYNEVRNSTIAYSYDSGIRILPGTIGNKVYNTVIHDTAYAGLDAAPIFAGGTQTDIRNNTLFNNGATPLLNLRDISNAKVLYNEVFNGGLQLSDNGGILAFNSDGQNTEIGYNAVHDIKSFVNYDLNYYGGPGIYLDGSYNYQVHHNVIWNTSTEGITLRPPNTGTTWTNQIYNNTLDDPIWFPPSGGNFTGTLFKNNIYAGLSRTQSRNDITFVNNLVSTATNPLFINPSQQNYQLQPNSPAIDAGAILPPFTDNFAGTAPDIGAFETGKSPFLSGSFLVESQIPQLEFTFNEPQDGKISGTITGLPVGRKLPNNFQLKIGNSQAGGIFNSSYIDPVTYQSTIVFSDVEVSDIRGNQSIFVQLGENLPIDTLKQVQLPSS